MSRLIFLSVCFAILGATKARMPEELRKILDMTDSEADVKAPMDNLKDDIKEELGSVVSSDFSVNKYISQSPSEKDAFETAWRKLGGKPVDQYKPPPITTVDCHVEYQVTKKVPGRCIRLPGDIPACQTEEYIGLNYNDCS